LVSSDRSSSNKANIGYPNTLEKQDLDSKSYLTMMIEDFKKGDFTLGPEWLE